MLSNVDLPKCFLAEAVSITCYLVNLSPSTSIDFNTLEEIWSGAPTNASHLQVFSCPTYFHVNDGKLKHRAKEVTFLSYAIVVLGYRLWCSDPKSHKFFINKDVTLKVSYFN